MTPTAITDLTSTPVPQLTSAQYAATLQDQSGAGVSAGSLSSLTLTLTDAVSGAIINGRNAQNTLNANNVTVDASGHLVWTMQPADSPIHDATREVENHVATFVVIWSTGRINHQVLLAVTNLGLLA